MRLGLFAGNEVDNITYTSLILKDAYTIYSPSKVKNGEIQNGILLSGRFQRIKIKRNKKNYDFNLN